MIFSKHLLKGILSLGLFATTALQAQQWGEYTLYSVQNSNAAYLIDTNNTTYHSWTFTSAPTAYSTYLLPGGTLLRTVSNSGNSFTGGGISGRVQKVDWSGNVVWDYVYSTTTYCMHHDICPMPNGNVLLISYESKTAAQVVQAGSSVNHIMWPDKIVEVQPTGSTTGTVVWEWHAWDHLIQSYDASKDNYGVTASHPELLNINYNNTSMSNDWLHINGIDYNANLDQIVISSHMLNELYVIDHSTTTAEAASHTGGNSGMGGDILYRWGNPAAYGATGTNVFHVVHDAHWVPDGCPRAGYLVGYNNNGISNSQSCVDLITPPYSGYNYTLVSGNAYGPSNYTYRHACNGHNGNMGNSQQLPNGNMLVCIAQSGLIYEIDSTGTQIWSKSVSGTVPQAFRYTACYVSGTMPTTPTITQNGGTLTSSTGVTYQWYLNGILISGATSSTYSPTQNGMYQVQITDASGCSSDLSSQYAYLSTGVESSSITSQFKLYPNPTTGLVNLEGLTSGWSDFNVRVYDLNGNCVIAAQNSRVLDFSKLSNGSYLVSVLSDEGGVINRRVVVAK